MYRTAKKCKVASTGVLYEKDLLDRKLESTLIYQKQACIISFIAKTLSIRVLIKLKKGG